MKKQHNSFGIGFVLLLSAGLPGIGIAADQQNDMLDLDIQQLMKVKVVSAAKRVQSLEDATAAVYVITKEDIHQSGVTTIADALALAPGLQVARISASKWSISSRGFAGFTSNKLLVMIDGRSVYSPGHSGTYWDSQNAMLEDVERIEVIRGPGGTLWGANAVNGVINIITKHSDDTQGRLVRVSAGDQEKFSTGLRYGGKLSDTASGRMYITYDDHGSNTLAGYGSDAHDGWQPFQGGFRMDGSPGSGKEWSLQGDMYDNGGDQIVFPYWTQNSPTPSWVNDSVNTKGGNLLGRWRQTLGEGNNLTFKTYYDYTDRQEKINKDTFNIADFDLQFETKASKSQNLTMGAGYRSIDGQFTRTYQVQLPDRSDNLYSAFLQDEINLVPDTVWLTLGSKYEHNDYTGNEWQPSGKLLWKPVEHHSIWTSVSRAVRTPTIVEQYGRVTVGVLPQGVGDVAFVGNPNFDSEIVYAYEVGYRWQASKSLSFDCAVFYNDYDKIYTVMPTYGMTGIDEKFVNAQHGAGYGFELVTDWKATSWLSFVASYSFLQLDLTTDAYVGSQYGSDFVEGTSPHHQASLRSSIAFAENWHLNIWTRYVDSIANRNSADILGSSIKIDSYLLFDANITWAPTKNIEFMLAGQNLLDEGRLQYVSEYSTPAEEIRRGVYVKATWRF